MKRIVLLFLISTSLFSLYAQEVDSIIDIRDSQVYKIVKIGQQWWMQENLNIGTRIGGTQDATNNGVIEKYCYDNVESNCDIYGGLYQWDEMMDYNPSDDRNPGITRGVCPAGWHLSTNAEWNELTDFLGGVTVAGGKLKETGTAHWTSPNEGATNESGFTALPGGLRTYEDWNFYYYHFGGSWWSDTESSGSRALNRELRTDDSYLYRWDSEKELGFSVRCLRDSCQFGYLTISDENFGLVTSLNFYGDDISERLILINSSAGKTINISSIYTNNPVFSLNKSSSTLSPGDSIHLTITFDPLSKDIYWDTLFVKSDDQYDSLITITLNGTFLPEISFTDSTNISCFGYFDGSATVTPSLGTPPYQYQWDDPGNTTDSTVTGLEANIYYHVTVTDSLGWTITDSIMLSQPLLLISQITDSTNISCFGYSDGMATVTPSGGTAPYFYLWDDLAGTTDSTVTGLAANLYYHVTINDANGCTITDSVILSQPDMFQSSVADSSNISCYGFSDGSAVITVTGGTRPYSYLWNDQAGTTDSTVTGLVANRYYHVNINDVNGCTVADSVMLSQPDLLTIDITDSSNISCYNVPNGTARITASGGTKPYSYFWNNPDNSRDSLATGLSANIYYHVTVSDAHSCPPVKDSVILSQPPLLVTDMTDSTNISCNGFSDGTATVTPSGGTPPYTYQWYDTGNSTDSTATGLSANHYYHVNVTDDLGCYTTDSIILSEPDPLEINPTYSDTICLYSSDGFINPNPSGGTAPYDYTWSNGLTSQILTGLEAGEYSVRVTDSQGCIDSADFVINNALPYDGEKICIVTVDLVTGKNLLIWEKTAGKGIESYKIYREGKVIGTVGFDDLSIIIDAEADPEKRSYLYKISVVDTCGNESELSPYHKPIFLQYISSDKGVMLTWSKYEIEGQILNFDSYTIYRGSDSTALSPLEANIPKEIDSYTDNDPNALTKKYYYRVAGVLTDPCNPSGAAGKKADSELYSNSMSNIEYNRIQETPEGVFYFNENEFRIIPNPFNESTTLLFNNPSAYSYTLYITDLSGKVCCIVDDINTSEYALEKGDLEGGILFYRT